MTFDNKTHHRNQFSIPEQGIMKGAECIGVPASRLQVISKLNSSLNSWNTNRNPVGVWVPKIGSVEAKQLVFNKDESSVPLRSLNSMIDSNGCYVGLIMNEQEAVIREIEKITTVSSSTVSKKFTRKQEIINQKPVNCQKCGKTWVCVCKSHKNEKNTCSCGKTCTKQCYEYVKNWRKSNDCSGPFKKQQLQISTEVVHPTRTACVSRALETRVSPLETRVSHFGTCGVCSRRFVNHSLAENCCEQLVHESPVNAPSLIKKKINPNFASNFIEGLSDKPNWQKRFFRKQVMDAKDFSDIEVQISIKDDKCIDILPIKKQIPLCNFKFIDVVDSKKDEELDVLPPKPKKSLPMCKILPVEIWDKIYFFMDNKHVGGNISHPSVWSTVCKNFVRPNVSRYNRKCKVCYCPTFDGFTEKLKCNDRTTGWFCYYCRKDTLHGLITLRDIKRINTKTKTGQQNIALVNVDCVKEQRKYYAARFYKQYPFATGKDLDNYIKTNINIQNHQYDVEIVPLMRKYLNVFGNSRYNRQLISEILKKGGKELLKESLNVEFATIQESNVFDEKFVQSYTVDLTQSRYYWLPLVKFKINKVQFSKVFSPQTLKIDFDDIEGEGLVTDFNEQWKSVVQEIDQTVARVVMLPSVTYYKYVYQKVLKNFDAPGAICKCGKPALNTCCNEEFCDLHYHIHRYHFHKLSIPLGEIGLAMEKGFLNSNDKNNPRIRKIVEIDNSDVMKGALEVERKLETVRNDPELLSKVNYNAISILANQLKQQIEEEKQKQQKVPVVESIKEDVPIFSVKNDNDAPPYPKVLTKAASDVYLSFKELILEARNGTEYSKNMKKVKFEECVNKNKSNMTPDEIAYLQYSMQGKKQKTMEVVLNDVDIMDDDKILQSSYVGSLEMYQAHEEVTNLGYAHEKVKYIVKGTFQSGRNNRGAVTVFPFSTMWNGKCLKVTDRESSTKGGGTLFGIKQNTMKDWRRKMKMVTLKVKNSVVNNHDETCNRFEVASPGNVKISMAPMMEKYKWSVLQWTPLEEKFIEQTEDEDNGHLSFVIEAYGDNGLVQLYDWELEIEFERKDQIIDVEYWACFPVVFPNNVVGVCAIIENENKKFEGKFQTLDGMFVQNYEGRLPFYTKRNLSMIMIDPQILSKYGKLKKIGDTPISGNSYQLAMYRYLAGKSELKNVYSGEIANGKIVSLPLEIFIMKKEWIEEYNLKFVALCESK